MARQTTKRLPPASQRTTRTPSRSSTRSASTRSPSRATATRPASRRRPPPPEPATHAREIWGIGLIVLAALTALGVWFESAGDLGVWLLLFFRGLFGVL